MVRKIATWFYLNAFWITCSILLPSIFFATKGSETQMRCIPWERGSFWVEAYIWYGAILSGITTVFGIFYLVRYWKEDFKKLEEDRKVLEAKQAEIDRQRHITRLLEDEAILKEYKEQQAWRANNHA